MTVSKNMHCSEFWIPLQCNWNFTAVKRKMDCYQVGLVMDK